MSELAPEPQPEQIPGQGQLFTEQVVGISPTGEDVLRLKEYDMGGGQRWMEDGLKGKDYSDTASPTITTEQPESVLSVPSETTEPEQPKAYESGMARGLDRLARFFARSAEVTDKGMEKAHRFGQFLGRTATRGEVFIDRVKETARKGKELWENGGDTKTKRLGNIANKAVLQPGLRGAEQAARHIGGKLSDNREYYAEGRANFFVEKTGILGRALNKETDPIKRAEIEREIAKLKLKETVAKTKATAHAARATHRRSNVSARLIQFPEQPAVAQRKAA